MANASDLPTEIWLLIARYLPKLQLFQLKSLNSFFLACWMDIAWRHVLIDTEFPLKAVRSLSRMADAFVATRTSRLTVCLRHFQKPKELSSRTTLSKLTSILLPTPKSQPTAPTFQSAISRLLLSLPLLPNITSLKIELWHIPLTLLPALFQTITSSPCAKTIQKLWLSGHVDMFASLAGYSSPKARAESPFGHLTDLNLEFIDSQLLNATTFDTTNNILNVADFVLSLSPSLQLLRVWNWSTTLDLSLFFSHLSNPSPNSPSLIPFPNLNSVFLILPFNISFQSSAESLRRFLLTHSKNLQHLQLRLKMKLVQLVQFDPRMEEPLGTWLADLVNDSDNDRQSNFLTFFPNLQTLDIYPSTTFAGLSALLTLIQRTAPTLSSLTIRDRYLSPEEANQVLDILTEGEPMTKPCPGGLERREEKNSSKLKSLRINITHLSVPFLFRLALTLPQLQKLWLSVSEIVGTDQHSFCELLQDRKYDRLASQDDQLTAWNLHDLSVWQAGQEMDDVVRAVAGAVSSVVLGHEEDGDSDE